MRQRMAKARSLLLLGLIVMIVAAGATAEARRPPEAEILIEGGAALPYGDLGDDYYNTVNGFGAETGYEIGLRLRYFFSPTLALAPSFHFTEFGNISGVDPEDGPFEVSTSVIRYGIDLQYFVPMHGSMLRPFLSAGASLSRDRYHDETETDQLFTVYEKSFNALAFALGGGFRLGEFEASVIYHVNRFDTVAFSEEGFKEDYNWDYLSVRVGFAFPTH